MQIAWGGHEKIAVGCSNGAVIVVDIGQAVREHLRQASSNGKEAAGSVEHRNTSIITQFFSSHDSMVRGLSWNNPRKWLREQRKRSDATQQPDVWPPPAPRQILSSANDGFLAVTDEREPQMPVHIHRVRGFLVASQWAVQSNVVLFADGENIVRVIRPGEDEQRTDKDDEFASRTQSRALMGHRGFVWSVSSSIYSPFAVSCAADGAVRVANWNRLGDRRHTRSVVHTLYKIEWTGDRHFSFIEETKREDFQPSNHKSGSGSLGALLPDAIALHKVVWNSDLCAWSWVASAGAAGLLRLDTVTNCSSIS
ncbi:hypothetical protein M427DRAFT_413310 [Gonapodya prolifera JEL478]|uniref:WD40 repeat-like protein n=1 Tax=Gonapodya prolifera (strain JEL478) TaxID=1344416 RepID=A0A139A6U5_GONPJ|nr:hypothetical protein M427DRAFT_413310 [Gonapodya prolifera JEL478]|eukprot:KXS12063.1 hypothetical protein M427DRAFT_413310 [Gonapodya prolifera JEL478]